MGKAIPRKEPQNPSPQIEGDLCGQGGKDTCGTKSRGKGNSGRQGGDIMANGRGLSTALVALAGAGVVFPGPASHAEALSPQAPGA